MKKLKCNVQVDNIFDKFICYFTVLCCLIYYRSEVDFALNLAIGFVSGGTFLYAIFNFCALKKILDNEED